MRPLGEPSIKSLPWRGTTGWDMRGAVSWSSPPDLRAARSGVRSRS